MITFVFAGVTLALFGKNALSWILLLALLQTALGYLGDLCTVARIRNLVIAVGNGFTAVLLAYILNLTVPSFHATWASLTAFGLLVAAGEYFLSICPSRTKSGT
jgi:hypothetical protein